MAFPDFRNTNNILNLIEFICAGVVVVLNFSHICAVSSSHQFVDGATITYLVISFFVAMRLFWDETIGLKTYMGMTATGMGFYIAVGVLLIQAGDEHMCSESIATISAGVVSLVAAVTYLIDLILMFKQIYI